MGDTEKITVNLGPVDLGRIDLLVDQGVYSNRTDLIRTAIRNQLDRHAAVVEEAVVRTAYTIGVYGLSRAELERYRSTGERLSLRVIGMVAIGRDVDPELARDTIESLRVHGVFRAPPRVKEALADRMPTGTLEE